MRQKKRPTVLISIENPRREFIPKLFLSVVLVDHGFRVILAQKPHDESFAEKLDRCIVFYKSPGWKAAQRLQAKKHVYIVQDEESAISIPENYLNQHCSTRYSRLDYQNVDLLLFNSPRIERAVESQDLTKNLKTRMFGWPKFDLWRKEMRKIFDGDADSIARKYGTFFLFPSAFTMNDPLSAINRIGSSHSSAKKERLIKKYRYFIKNLAALREASIHLKPNESIVVRPHSSESVKTWRRLLKGLPNVYVDGSGDIHAWLNAATGVWQTGSTVGIHGTFCGLRSGAIVPDAGDEDLCTGPAFEHCFFCSSSAEILAGLRQGPRIDRRLAEEVENAYRDEVPISGELASVAISEYFWLIRPYGIDRPNVPKDIWWSAIQSRIWRKVKGGALNIAFRREKGLISLDLFYHRTRVEKLVSRMLAALGKEQNILVKEVSGKSIILESGDR